MSAQSVGLRGGPVGLTVAAVGEVSELPRFPQHDSMMLGVSSLNASTRGSSRLLTVVSFLRLSTSTGQMLSIMESNQVDLLTVAQHVSTLLMFRCSRYCCSFSTLLLSNSTTSRFSSIRAQLPSTQQFPRLTQPSILSG